MKTILILEDNDERIVAFEETAALGDQCVNLDEHAGEPPALLSAERAVDTSATRFELTLKRKNL